MVAVIPYVKLGRQSVQTLRNETMLVFRCSHHGMMLCFRCDTFDVVCSALSGSDFLVQERAPCQERALCHGWNTLHWRRPGCHYHTPCVLVVLTHSDGDSSAANAALALCRVYKVDRLTWRSLRRRQKWSFEDHSVMHRPHRTTRVCVLV